MCAKSFRKKIIKTLKTTLITSFILLLAPFIVVWKYSSKKRRSGNNRESADYIFIAVPILLDLHIKTKNITHCEIIHRENRDEKFNEPIYMYQNNIYLFIYHFNFAVMPGKNCICLLLFKSSPSRNKPA